MDNAENVGTVYAPTDAQYLTSATASGLSNERVVGDSATIVWDFTGIGTATAALQHLGLEDLADPGGDRIAFWDDSEGAFKWLDAGQGLDFTGTNIHVTDELLDLINLEFVSGDVLYHDGTNLKRLAAGTDGQFLRTRGTTTAPDWQNISGGGDMLRANNLSDLDSASTARTNLGVAIGTNVQAYDATLQSLSALGTVADRIAYTTALDTWAETTLTSFARTILDDANQAAVRTTLALTPGTDVQAHDAGLLSIAGLTTAADKMIYTTALDTYAVTDLTAFARSILDDADEATFKATVNLEIGVDVQAYDDDLMALAGLAKTDGNFIVGDGAAWTVESGATARTSLGLGTGDSPQFTAVNVGHASDTPLARIAAGRPSVAGVELARIVVPYGATTTINVPADYATIAAAWAAIQDWIVNGTLIIQVADGTHTITSALTLEHPFGENIRLIGNTSTPTNCVIKVSTAINGIYVGDGCSIDLIDGFRIYHDTLAARASTAGILADRGASVKLGTAVRVEGFYWGYFARRGSYIEALSTQATACGDAGYHALDGGMIDATSSTSTNNNASGDSLGCGYVAEGGIIIANSATATGNWLHGFNAIQNGRIKCTSATGSTSTTGNGFNADTGGAIYAHGANADGNAGYGWAIVDDASIITGTITNSGTANTSGLFRPYLEEFLSTQPGSRVVSTSTNADRRYDTKGTGSHFINVDGTVRLTVATAGITAAVPVTITSATASLLTTTTENSANVQLARFDSDRASAATSDQSYTSYYMSDTTGTQREAVRLTNLVADGIGASWRTQLLLSLATGGTLTSMYRLSTTAISPVTNDAAALGSATTSWSDLFLASGAVINFNNGDVTVTHGTNSLAFAGASSGYTFDALVSPASNDGAALGTGSVSFSDLFLASGGVINFNNGDVTVTHSANTLTIAGGITALDASSTVGGAVIKTAGTETIWVPAKGMTARTTNGAASGTTESTTNDVVYPTFDFDQSTEEGVGFWIAMPKSWNESTVTFIPYWTAASGSGGVVFAINAYAFSNDDAIDTAPSGQQTSTDTLIATGDIHVGPESSAITIGGTPAEGDIVYFQITREVGDGSDTLSGDAKLIGVKVIFTTNAATDA